MLLCLLVTLLITTSVFAADPPVGAETPVAIAAVIAESGTVAQDGTLSTAVWRVGDTAADVSERLVLSFDTASLPDDAIVLGAELTLTRGVDLGQPAGPVWIDMAGAFGVDANLAADDFDAVAGLSRVAFVALNANRGVLNNAARFALDVSGPTQLRLRTVASDNGVADAFVFTAASLEVTYASPASGVTTADLQPIMITLDPVAPANAGQATVSGSLNPTDALLLVDSSPVDVFGDGSFTVTRALDVSTDNWRLQGFAANRADTTLSQDVVNDQTAPVISITAPQPELRTNRDRVDVFGRMEDGQDRQPTLRLDGSPVTLNGKDFSVLGLVLVEGTNIFVLEATDASGNSSQATLHVYRDTTPPSVVINAPDDIAKNGSFTLSLSITPATDVAAIAVTVANEQTYNGADTTWSTTVNHDGMSHAIPVDVAVRDVYGNLAEVRKDVRIAGRRYVEGRVLTHADSLPVAGVGVTLTTPYESSVVTTDGTGRYFGYIQGAPLDVSVRHAGHVAATRRVMGNASGARVQDVRLVALGTTPTNAADFRASYAGSGTVTALDGQSLPALLPLGYAPAAGAAISGATGAATLTLTPTEAAGELTLLALEARAWRVLENRAAGGSLVFTADTGDGALVVAMRDATVTAPAVGELIRREEDEVLTLDLVAQLAADPAEVSIIDDPQTTLYLMASDTITSGARLRLRVGEVHDQFDRTIALEDDQLDVFVYRESGRALAALPVRAKLEVDPNRTREAVLRFNTEIDEGFTAQFPTQNTANIGGLVFDFSAWPQPLMVRLTDSLAQDLPLPSGADVLERFDFWVGGTFTPPPTLTYTAEANAYAGLVLLRRQDQGRWTTVDRFTDAGGLWTNDPATSDMTADGTYALVGLQDAITAVSGTVLTAAAQPATDFVRITNTDHPWAAHHRADGSYRALLRSTAFDLTLRAYQPTTRTDGDLVIADQLGATDRTNQDITLGAVDFRLTEHQPAADEQFTSRTPEIRLVFSMPATTDQANLAANITLTDDQANAVGLNILVDGAAAALSILPAEALLPDRLYTLSLATGLQNLYGDALVAPTTFSFRTRATAVSGDLDLTRFYLTYVNDQLTLNAPQEAFPARTYLNILNMRTAQSWSRQMTGGADFSFDLDGEPGDVIDIEATTPDGKVESHRLDLVKLDGDGYRIGASPFTLKLSNDITLRIDSVDGGFGQDVDIRLKTPTEAQAVMDAVEAFDGQNLTVAQMISFTARGDQLVPMMRGRIEAPVPTDPGQNLLRGVRITPNVETPTSPVDPTPLLRTVAHVMDQIQVEDGQVQTKGRQTKTKTDRRGKLFLVSAITMYQDEMQRQMELAVIESGVNQIDAQIRVGRPPSEFISRPESSIPAWAEEDGLIHVPQANVFMALGDSYKHIGVTGVDGVVTAIFDEAEEDFIGGVDYVTGQYKIAQWENNTRSNTNLGAFENTYFRRYAITFDQDLTADGTVSAGRLDFKWQVGTLDQAGDFLLDVEATEEVQNYRRVRINANILRAVLTDRDNLKLQNPEARVDGTTYSGAFDGPGKVVFDFPSFLATPGFLAFVFQADNARDQTLTVRRDLHIYDDALIGQDVAGRPGLVYTTPDEGEQNAPIDQDLYLRFSEPVTALAANIALMEDTDAIAFNLYDTRGLPIAPTDFAEEVLLRPQRTLRFGQSYRLQVGAVVDQGGLALDADGNTAGDQPRIVRFRTKVLSEGDRIAGAGGELERMAYDTYRNLAVVAHHSAHQNGITFAVYDLRQPNPGLALRDLTPVWISDELPAAGAERYAFGIFTPDDLAPDAFGLKPSADNNHPVDFLPDGSYFFLNGIGGDGKAFLRFYRLTNGQLQRWYTLNVPASGIPYISDKIGAYFAVAFHDMVSRSGARVYDVRRMVEEVRLLQEWRTQNGVSQEDFDTLVAADPSLADSPLSSRMSGEQYFDSLITLSTAAYFGQPSRPRSLDAFFRFDGATYRPTLLINGGEYPGMFDFVPDAPQGVSPANPLHGLDFLDNRLLVRTENPVYTHIHSYTAAAPQTTWRTNGNGALVTKDLAIFSHYQNNASVLRIFDVPGDKQPLDGAASPLLTINFPDIVRALAFDDTSGLLAVQISRHQVNILSLRQLMEQHQGVVAYADLAADIFLFESPLSINFGEMRFHGGNLMGIDRNGNQDALRIIPIQPLDYRAEGWLVHDLSAWTNRTASKNDPAPQVPVENLLFRAADRRVVGGDERKFVMEAGSYQLKLKPGEELEAQFTDETGQDVGSLIQRANIPAEDEENPVERNVLIATTPVLDDLSDVNRQRKLRERGYLDYSLTITINQGPRVLETRTVPVVIVHQLDDTRHVDDARHLAPGLDALTRTPWLHEVDHALSAGTAAQDVSPARHYHGRHAFAPGDRGVGMLDPRKLYAAMPLWWDVDAVAAQGWAGATPIAELTLEQPGNFSVSGELSEDDYRFMRADFHNDLWSSLRFDAGRGDWRFTHRDEVGYSFGPNYALPDLSKVFRAARQLWDGDDPTTLRLPMARGTDADGFAADLVPMNIRINSHQRWGVNLYFRTDNKASAYPDHIQQNASGSRTLRRFYQEGADRPLVYRSRLADDDLTLNYSYDAHGYLTSVTRNGQRERRYEWEDLGVAMDGHCFKRLRRVTQGDELIEYRYADAQTLRVSEVVTSFGTKAVTLVEAHADGTAKTLRLQGLDTPDQVRSFDLSNGVLLSSSIGYGADVQQLDYARTWTAIDDAQRREWRLLTDAYQSQTYAYDTKGRMTSATRLGRTTAWTYGNQLRIFRLYPDSLTDPAGQTFAIETIRNQSTISLGDLSETTHYGGDGAILGVTDVYGFGDIAARSKLFAPSDDRHQAKNGRPTAAPYYGEATAVFEAAYNSFGEPTQALEAGVKTEYLAYDANGRPTQIRTFGDRDANQSYAYQGDRFIVTHNDIAAGTTTVTAYDELGRAREVTHTQAEGTSTQAYTYDTLGRPLQDRIDDLVVRDAIYSGERNQPDQVSYPQKQETLTYQIAADQRILGITRTLESLSETVPFETDILGRVIRERQDGLGVVLNTYDTFDRLTETRLDPAALTAEQTTVYGPLKIRYEYGFEDGAPLQTTTNDFQGLIIQATYFDGDGRNFEQTLSGYDSGLILGGVSLPPGLNQTLTRRQTTSIDAGSIGDKGHLLQQALTGGEVQTTNAVSTTGYLFDSSYGKYQTTASRGNLGPFGEPTSWTGAFTGDRTFDALGRLIQAVDAHGHTTQTTGFDKFDRPVQMIDTRNKIFDASYQALTPYFKTVTATPQVSGQKAGLPVALIDNATRLSSSANTWLGGRQTSAVTDLGKQVQITKDSDGGVQATVDVDSDAGLTAQFTSFTGEAVSVETLPGGRAALAVAADGTEQLSIFNALGQLDRVYRDRTLVYEVVMRDRDGRPLQVVTQDEVVNHLYENEDLTQVQANGQHILFENYNAIGKPETLTLGAAVDAPDYHGSINLDYHPGGIPKTLNFLPNGGDDIRLDWNNLGDLTDIDRRYGADVSFDYNAWGAPSQMNFAGGSFSLFDLQTGSTKAAQRTLQLPAGNVIELDAEGREIRHAIPGLAQKTTEYDGDGRVAKIYLDGVLWQEFDYTDGRLSERRAIKDGALQIQYQYGYDERGRLAQVTDQISGASFSWTYVDSARGKDQDAYTDRVKTYTDANDITYAYTYDAQGRINRLGLSGGPTFVYEYDVADNLAKVSVDGMGAEFENYQRGVPTTMRWFGGPGAREFTITQSEGRPTNIISSDLAHELDLSWTGDDLTEVARKGPGFEETLTPTYLDDRLQNLTIARGTGQTIIETTNVGGNRLLSELTRTVDGQTLLDLTATFEAEDRRIAALTGGGATVLDPGYDAQGNLITMDRNTAGGVVQDTYAYDALRRLTDITLANGVQPIALEYSYDPAYRRIAAQETGRIGKVVYAYHGSKLLATGIKVGQTVQWYQAFLHGPLGPILTRDLTGHDQNAFILSDQVGTPFAYIDGQSGQTTYTPFSPLGEALFDHPTPVPAMGDMPGAGTATFNTGFQLPNQPPIPATVGQLGALHTALGALPTLGLGAHPYDALTGMTYMHHRYYHARLGHFLNPDFRVPDIYDPRTMSLPYAYAAGNPIMFWDPDGLVEVVWLKPKTNDLAAFGGVEASYESMVTTDAKTQAIIREAAGTADQMLMGALEAVGGVSADTVTGIGQLAILLSKAQNGDIEAIKTLAGLGLDIATFEVFREQGRQLGVRLSIAEQAAIKGDFREASKNLSRVGIEVGGIAFGAMEGAALGVAVTKSIKISSTISGKLNIPDFQSSSTNLLGEIIEDLNYTSANSGHNILGLNPKSIAQNDQLLGAWIDGMRHLYGADTKGGELFRKYLTNVESGVPVSGDAARAVYNQVRNQFLRNLKKANFDLNSVSLERLHHWNWPISNQPLNAINPHHIFPVSHSDHMKIHRFTTMGPHPTKNPVDPSFSFPVPQNTPLPLNFFQKP